MTSSLLILLLVTLCYTVNIANANKRVEIGGIYQFKYLPVTTDECLNILIKGEEAQISLSNAPQLINPKVIIEIGGLRNKQSAIHGNYEGKAYNNKISTPDILDKTKYNQFWIKWTESGDVFAGRQSVDLPFLTHKIPETRWAPINFVGFACQRRMECTFILLDNPQCPSIAGTGP